MLAEGEKESFHSPLPSRPPARVAISPPPLPALPNPSSSSAAATALRSDPRARFASCLDSAPSPTQPSPLPAVLLATASTEGRRSRVP
jgi:hypothetical protein